jgi:hypothetical protein
MAMNTIVVGAHAKAYVNGQFWGNVRRFRFRILSTHREQRGLDSLLPFELIPTSYSVSGSMEMYRQHGDGGLEGKGLMASSTDLPREKYVTFTLVNRLTDEILFRTDMMKFTDQDWDVPAKGVVNGRAAFVGIGCRTSLQGT